MEKVENKDKVMRASLIILVAVVAVFAAALIFAGKNASEVTTNFITEQEEKLSKAIININGNHLIASVASSQRAKSRGLSGVASIPLNEAKAFVFDREDFHTFHMKDMKFPLDFIFVNDQGTVVDVVTNVNPDFEGTITSKYPASTVYEVNAGWVAANNIEVGQTVTSVDME